ncbi:hypothetical protein BJ741DRAFT_705073 [Chytriomyces cf. hyalinus JEL632]|nr:hypothetical protein BJ741DRAFT_705073 [Chytriomyces cf. hyalinus JEL632]
MNPSVHPALLLSSLLASPMLQSLLQSTPTNSHTPPDLFDFLAPVMKAPQNSAHAQSEAAPSLSQLLSFIPVAQAPPGYGTSFISDTLSPPQSAIVSPPPEYNFPRELSVADSTSSQDCIQKRSISRAPRSTPTDTAAASTHRSNQKIRLSKQERDLLEQIYQECAVPESDVIRKAAKQIGRKYRHIQYWFQNRRRKQRAM